MTDALLVVAGFILAVQGMGSAVKLRVWRFEGCEIVAATPERAVEIGRKHLVGLTVRELRTWQEMLQEPLAEIEKKLETLR
jgi:hypothetical protein